MKKPIVIFVHGWGADNNVWMNQKGDAFLTGFEKRFVELPGHGRSARAWDKTGLEPAVETILDFLAINASASQGRSISAVGWSLGAAALMAVEASNPGTFDKLALVGATPCFVQKDGYAHGQPRPLVRRMIMDMKAAPGLTLARFFKLNFTREEMESEPVANYMKRAIEGTRKADFASIVTALDTLYRTDLRSVVSKIKADTLIIHGSSDAVTPVEAADFLRERIKNSTLNVFDDAGHAPHVSRVEAFNGVVESFLLK